MFFSVLLVLLLPPFVYSLFSYLHHLYSCRNYPPGLFPYPIVGNILQFGEKSHETFKELSKVYGDIFSVSIGYKRVVVVSGKQYINEVLQKQGKSFIGRRKQYAVKLYSKNYQNVAHSDGNLYVKHVRKHLMSKLKVTGEAKMEIEKAIVLESSYLHKQIMEDQGKETGIYDLIYSSTFNMISTLLLGKRLDFDDPEFKEIISFSRVIFEGILSIDSSLVIFPWLKFFPLRVVKDFHRGIKSRDEFFERKIKEHRQHEQVETSDLIHSLLTFASSNIEQLGEISDARLCATMSDILLAGTETTGTALLWCLVYLLNWPEYQEIIRNEIKNVAGENGYVTLSNKSSMHFTQAFIYEMLRKSSIAPFAAPHRSVEDANICGIFFPNDTVVLENLHHLHHDERYWDEPNKFNPYRWLDEHGEFQHADPEVFLPFSIGPRVCIGVTLAKAEIFLFLTRLLRDFQIKAPAECGVPSMAASKCRMTHSPMPFKAIFIRNT